MSTLIRQALVDGKKRDILIEGNQISKIGDVKCSADTVLHAEHMAALPSFINAHTHAAMTLMRGYADDMQLDEWLNAKIWPLEAKLTEHDVYVGSKLACLEMIKTGTTFFNDMYWHFHGTAKAVEEMGIRAAVSAVLIDMFDRDRAEQQIKLNTRLYAESKEYKRAAFALGPHALYTVSPDTLQWCKDFADKHGVLVHFHLSETDKEVHDCIKAHGMRPVEYLDKLGFLGPNLIACHAVWLDDREIALLKKHDVKLAHNPVSNMKLASGSFKFDKLSNEGLTLSLGTDGCASNNNLDMLEEMKFAAVRQKHACNDPTAMDAHQVFDMATKNGARAFRLNCGEIREGMLADLILVDLKHHSLVPNHNLISNLVYSATSECINTTICDGKILMQDRKVNGEETILEEAQKVAEELVRK